MFQYLSKFLYGRSYYVTKCTDSVFRVLNLKTVRTKPLTKRRLKKPDVLLPRGREMAVDQNWGSVWPGPRSFHPATVPLPIRQGYAEKGASPSKYGNAELMKVPNFLHLTPPVIKSQCKALKQFCTAWPKKLKSDVDCANYFPIEIAFSHYCYSSPSIREPLARIVTLKIKLSSLPLNKHAKDKFLRLIGNRYDEETDIITIVTDRCPLRKQNYDYAMYLITALFHESWRKDSWENLKSDADMEYYNWNANSPSKVAVEQLFKKPFHEITHCNVYAKAVNGLMNEDESEYNVTLYGYSVRQMFCLPLN